MVGVRSISSEPSSCSPIDVSYRVPNTRISMKECRYVYGDVHERGLRASLRTPNIVLYLQIVSGVAGPSSDHVVHF